MRMAGRPHGSLLMLHERQTKCVKMRPKTFHHLFHPSLAAYFLFCGAQLQYGLLTSFEGEFARGRLSRFVLRATSVNFHKAVRNFTHAQPSRVGPKRNSVGDCHGVQEMIVQKTTFMLPDFLTFWLSDFLHIYASTGDLGLGPASPYDLWLVRTCKGGNLSDIGNSWITTVNWTAKFQLAKQTSSEVNREDDHSANARCDLPRPKRPLNPRPPLWEDLGPAYHSAVP